VAFFDGLELKRVAIAGGPATTICKVPLSSRGGTWAGDTIVFATLDPQSGLWSVPAAPRMLTKPDPQRGERDHLFPSFLPGGTSVLFTITSTSAPNEEPSIAVLNLKTGSSKAVLKSARQAVYSPTGHLVYAAEGSLHAAAFDLATSSVSGSPVLVMSEVPASPVSRGFASPPGRGFDFAIAGDGTTVYIPAPPVVDEPPRG
jgi:hypothetical protein